MKKTCVNRMSRATGAKKARIVPASTTVGNYDEWGPDSIFAARFDFESAPVSGIITLFFRLSHALSVRVSLARSAFARFRAARAYGPAGRREGLRSLGLQQRTAP